MNITTSIPVIGKLDTLSLTTGGLKEIGKIIGVIRPEIDIQEMGDKALQAEADGITPEKYDTYSDYVAALDSYVVSPERTQKISEELKEIKGVEIAVCLMVEKLADTPIFSFLKAYLIIWITLKMEKSRLLVR